jgi:hypothetical protein
MIDTTRPYINPAKSCQNLENHPMPISFFPNSCAYLLSTIIKVCIQKVSLRHAEKTFQQVVTGKPCEVGHDNNVEQKIRPTVVHCDSSTSNMYAIIVLKL